MKKTLVLLTICFALAPAAFRAQAQEIQIRLSELESSAINNSELVLQAEQDLQASQSRVKATRALGLPKLSLDASYRYVTEVPVLQMSPALSIPFGDNRSYSVGPSLSWMIWDSGATSNAVDGALSQQRAREEDLKARRQQVLLNVRLSYYRVQLALRNVNMIYDTLKFAQAQNEDIQKRVKAGASSRSDYLSSHQQVLLFSAQLKQAQSDLANELRDLARVSNLPALVEGHDLSGAFPAGIGFEASELARSSVLIRIEKSANELLQPEPSQPSTKVHPLAQSLKYQALSQKDLADSASSAHWPKVSVQLKSSYDYPNGPRLESVQQNTVALNASWSIYEFGRVSAEVNEKARTAQALEYRAQAAEQELKRDYDKARDSLQNQLSQMELRAQAQAEAEQLLRVVTESYRSGRVSFLEVQNAQLKELEAKINKARTETQILMQQATISYLGGASI